MLDIIRRPSSSLGISTFEELDKLLDNFWKTSNMPSVDIYSEDDQHMVVEMQTPGFNEDDLEINVRNGVLEIRGETRSSSEQKDKQRSYLMRESFSSFARRVVLPDNANPDNISAELDKGVLRVVVPVEQHNAKQVKIISKSGNKVKEVNSSNK
jgi:HSP20 family protein